MDCPTCGQECGRYVLEGLHKDTFKMITTFAERGVHLTATEARILSAVKSHNRPVSRSLIVDLVYGVRPDGDIPGDKTLDVFIYKIRSKIRKSGLPWRLETIHGLGWRLHEEQTSKTLRNAAIGLGATLLLAQPIVSRLIG